MRDNVNAELINKINMVIGKYIKTNLYKNLSEVERVI